MIKKIFGCVLLCLLLFSVAFAENPYSQRTEKDNLKANHIAEKTAGHGTIIDNDLTFTGNMKITGFLAAPTALTAAVGEAGTEKYCSAEAPCTYYVTFVTANGETQGGVESNAITTDNVKINLSNIPIGPAGTTARNIYRALAAYSINNLVTTISDNTTTTYIDDIDTVPTLLSHAEMPLSNTTAGGFYVGTVKAINFDQNGNAFIGSIATHYAGSTHFAIGRTFTENATAAGQPKYYIGLQHDNIVVPSGESGMGVYVGEMSTIQVPATNTNNILLVNGMNYTVSLNGSGTIGSVDNTFEVINNASTANAKALWAHGGNYSTVSGFFYGFQANVDNWGNSATGTGSIAQARAGRFRIQNSTLGTNGVANITSAQAVYANTVTNSEGNYGTATITTATGFHYDVTNGAGGVITNSYGAYFSTPVNSGGSGAIVNHTGIYLADQTVAGSTVNYAIYSAGGLVHFTGNVDTGGSITQNTVKSCTLGVTTDANGVLSGCVTSDESLKNSIMLYEEKAFLVLNNIKPYHYKWNNTLDKDDGIHLGFIAQEVEKVFPEAVTRHKIQDGEQLGIDSNAINALLVKAVQEQHLEIKKLQKELKYIRKKLKEKKII